MANRKGSEKPEIAAAMRAAGMLIEQARERSGLTRKEACSYMHIDEGQYSKWANGALSDSASFPRMLLLPPSFWFHLNQLLNERFGLRRLIVAQLLGAAADLALAVDR
jgi:transcriptional regulator with XRE-family HTH domain